MNTRIDLTTKLCQVIQKISDNGWCQGTGGNFSVVWQQSPLRLIITQSGKDKHNLQLQDFVAVDDTAQAIADETGRPSAETLLHCFIASQLKASSVLHTHSVWNTLLGEHFCQQQGFTITGYEMLKGIQGITTHEAKVFVPIIENSQDMNIVQQKLQNIAQKHSNFKGFLLAGHGLYTWGDSLEEAYRHVEIFEFLFECVGRRTKFREFLG